MPETVHVLYKLLDPLSVIKKQSIVVTDVREIERVLESSIEPPTFYLDDGVIITPEKTREILSHSPYRSSS